MKNKVKIIYIIIIASILLMVGLITTMVININKVYSNYKKQIIGIRNEQKKEDNTENSSEEASSSIGKKVQESKDSEDENNSNVENEDNSKQKIENKSENTTNDTTDIKKQEQTQDLKKEEVIIPDPTFIKPIEGEILKEFSNENLLYSETLKEWTTHTGIDISADMSTVVKSAAEGMVKAIKNDPRYGITVILTHANGYETRYSNLLTAEFIKEGEKVKQGQTIGTVGNTATFEIADNSHLHFEILKNSEYVNPVQYFK